MPPLSVSLSEPTNSFMFQQCTETATPTGNIQKGSLKSKSLLSGLAGLVIGIGLASHSSHKHKHKHKSGSSYQSSNESTDQSYNQTTSQSIDQTQYRSNNTIMNSGGYEQNGEDQLLLLWGFLPIIIFVGLFILLCLGYILGQLILIIYFYCCCKRKKSKETAPPQIAIAYPFAEENVENNEYKSTNLTAPQVSVTRDQKLPSYDSISSDVAPSYQSLPDEYSTEAPDYGDNIALI